MVDVVTEDAREGLVNKILYAVVVMTSETMEEKSLKWKMSFERKVEG